MKEEKKFNYFYKIVCSLNGCYYYGVHGTNKLDDGYICSSKYVKNDIKLLGESNFSRQILKYFDTFDEALLYEKEIVNQEMIYDPSCYNKCIGGMDGYKYTIGMVTVKDKGGNTFNVSKKDERYLSGELVGATKNKVPVKDKQGNYFSVNINDKRYLCGEFIPISTGKSPFKDLNGKIYYLDTNDNLIQELNLTGLSKNKVLCKDKDGNCYSVFNNDERYINGELIPIQCNKKHSKETKHKMRETHKLNKHQQGEKNSSYDTIWIYNLELKQNLKLKKEQLNEYLDNGWIKGRKMKF